MSFADHQDFLPGDDLFVIVGDQLYTVVLEASEDGGYTVGCPGLPGCWSQGATQAEALAMIADAITEYLAAIDDGLAVFRKIPFS